MYRPTNELLRQVGVTVLRKNEGESKPNTPGSEKGDARRDQQAAGRRGNGSTKR